MASDCGKPEGLRHFEMKNLQAPLVSGSLVVRAFRPAAVPPFRLA